ncbi:dehydrogenase [Streptomyces sp. AJS327]|uniref:zinc-dependent alcohol dehydrogenase n=1 Tax=Streptomyces sp. AJS327 TaxID=2545265 RepID=UPI0015DF74E8|nr:alcohol dehydrogenase catalytic domain-containing protein [Streptomyces sp. AJS327]MBA0049980.1 dehydrogenase [Streptomyces sp. AJS327]
MTGAPHATRETSARAVVVDGPRQYRLVRGVPALPGPHQVRVAVYAAGVSATERALYEGTPHVADARYPVTPGREWSGTVDAVGEDTDPSLLGRKVVAEGIRSCLSCARCREGATPLCLGGAEITGVTLPGAFADALTLPARLLHLLRDEADLTAAALLQPGAVAAAAVLAGEPRPGERVAVLGAGTLGLLTVQLLAAVSPVELLVVDPLRYRAERALRLGASGIHTPDDLGSLRGRCDLVVETAGANESALDACQLARRGGRTVLTGSFDETARGIDPGHLITNQLTVRTVCGAPPAAWSYAVRAFTAGQLDPARLISHALPLSEFPRAVALSQSGGPEVGKVLLCPGTD